MITKIYVKTKEILKENAKTIITFFFLLFFLFFPLPYYIDTPGGIIDIQKKIELEKPYKSRGSFNFSYVSEMKATPFTYLLSLFHKDWEVLKKEEVKYDNETIKEMNFRDHMLLTESYDNAIYVAFQKAEKEVKVQRERLFVTYVNKKAKTTLKNGDEIKKVDGKIFSTKKDLLTYIRGKKEKDILKIEVINGKKREERKAEIICEGKVSMIGVMINADKQLETNPFIKIHSKQTESGPSGGLMLSLSIYDALVEEDITKGLKIVGTGMIDENGKVGTIGGVPFKLRGAVKKKADLFLVPKGENYEEAIKIKKEEGYTIPIVGVSSFDEVLTYLKEKSE